MSRPRRNRWLALLAATALLLPAASWAGAPDWLDTGRRARDGDRPPAESWMNDPGIASLDVVADSTVDVTIVDPLGRRDTWTGEPHVSPIPQFRHFTGYARIGDGWGHVVPLRYWSASWLKPVRGKYVVIATARQRTHGGVSAQLPERHGCMAWDTLTFVPHRKYSWTVEYSAEWEPGECWIHLKRVAPPPGHMDRDSH